MEPREERSGGDGVDGGVAAGKSGYLRIYVGGLGGNVTVDDLKKTFSSAQLGTVESVEIIRTKGRSFAYLDFCPCSDKGLAKLFSTYNGCMWKGGRLRLEKAKEHYKLRLRREWVEDAELSSVSNKCVDSAAGGISPPERLVKNHGSENVQLRMFFPKLRKVKPIPFKGTGKHKYSFQRIEVPSLPIHFCDCDEHSGPSDTAKGPYNQENEACGINEEELNMMKFVMSKLFEREKVSEPAHNKVRFTTEAQILPNSNNDFQVDEKADEMSDEDNLVMNMVMHSDDKIIPTGALGKKTVTNNEESRTSQSRPFQRKGEIQGKKPFKQDNAPEWAYTKAGFATEPQMQTTPKDDFQVGDMENEMSDEDNLIINVVAGSNDKITLAHSWGEKTITSNEVSKASRSEPGDGKHGTLRKKAVQSNKKRKVAPDDDGDKTGEQYAAKRKGILDDTSADVESYTQNQAAELGAGVQSSSNNNLHGKRFSWRDLVSGRDDGCFRISDVIPSTLPTVAKQSQSDSSDVPKQENQRIDTSQAKVVNISEAIVQMPIVEASKAGESTSWIQKSSWKHLVGGSDDNSFSISQIVAEMNVEKQEIQQAKEGDTSASKNSRQQSVMEETKANTDTLGKSSPDQARLGFLSPVKELQVGKSGEVAGTSQLPGKQLMPTKHTALTDNVTGETFTFKRNSTSVKEWKMAKAALSGSLKKKVNET